MWRNPDGSYSHHLLDPSDVLSYETPLRNALFDVLQDAGRGVGEVVPDLLGPTAMDTLRDRRHLEELWASGRAPWKVWA